MVAEQRMFNGFPQQSEDSIHNTSSWRSLIYPFFFLLAVIWVDEIFDIPHLLFGAEKTLINWQEVFSETFLIAVVGVFAVSRLFYTPSLRKESQREFAMGNIWFPLAFIFILLSFLIWLNELIDLPHLLFNGESTPVNWIEATSETVMILGIGMLSVSMLVRNVVDRERAESRVRKERMFSNTLIQTSPVFFVAINPEGNILMMNDEMLGVLGYTHDEVRDSDYLNTFVPEREHDLYRDGFRKLVASNKTTNTESHVVNKDGRELLIEWFSRPIFTEEGDLDFIFSVGSDITKRRNFEIELKTYQEQLQELNIHTEQVRERERTRIARELHDELGQLLTVLKMDLAYVDRNLPRRSGKLGQKISDMYTRVDSTLNSLKRIMTDLRPSLLDNLGLVAAIEWQAEDFQSHTGITCNVSVQPEDLYVEPGTATTVFRIFQETLTNVARHAQASKVTVTLEDIKGEFRLVVKDNGRGISPEKISNPKSYGLMGIRERVKHRGGEVKIASTLRKGTTVTVTIPLMKES
ncbi:MAG TPA: PAS domain-containing sensor histidine kinase [Deltaproteobacteria bacterium]|nr:PAS domain-containing sensor histidine kinase [Deltaproteobacteria bacterium]HPJ93183.1 PAS domain-containing sensor histidine kinase [Deltaproteobacteria bacterium]HPR50847.1 PAS domain-containing sensor histidine kinase [Deltaproteobacteria bacterium]